MERALLLLRFCYDNILLLRGDIFEILLVLKKQYNPYTKYYLLYFIYIRLKCSLIIEKICFRGFFLNKNFKVRGFYFKGNKSVSSFKSYIITQNSYRLFT